MSMSLEARDYAAVASAAIGLIALALGLFNFLRDRPRIRLELTFEEMPIPGGKTFPTPTLWVRNRSRYEIEVQKAGIRLSEPIKEAHMQKGIRDAGTLLRPVRSDVFIPEKDIDPKEYFADRYVLPRMKIEAHAGVRLYFDTYLFYKRQILAAKGIEVHLGHGALYTVSARLIRFAWDQANAARNRKAFAQLIDNAQKAIDQNITPYADNGIAGIQREVEGGGTSGQSTLVRGRIETGE